MIARYQGHIIAQSDDTVVIEGNHYFPRTSLTDAYFSESDHTSVCHWKGTAHYLHVEVGGQRNENAAWFYPETKSAADVIKDKVAFWRGVEVSPE